MERYREYHHRYCLALSVPLALGYRSLTKIGNKPQQVSGFPAELKRGKEKR